LKTSLHSEDEANWQKEKTRLSGLRVAAQQTLACGIMPERPAETQNNQKRAAFCHSNVCDSCKLLFPII
jgi:hypothetical protein